MKRLFVGSFAVLLTTTTAISSIPTPVQALTAGEVLGIGAAAVGIGILAGQRNRNDRHSNHRGNREQEYRRGLRDGERSRDYYNSNNSSDYERGYREGVDQRRDNYGRYSGSSRRRGSTPENLISTVPSNLADLVGARAGQAEGELQRRGYTYHTTQTFEGGASAYYVENETGYCVEVGTVEGRFSSIVYNSSDRCN
ncbi:MULTISPECIES: hypothetical protein [unclassified Nostoc]|uniref:hypothetical protein n=1 Tax=unclassified Nostoc TaxID=2593658 RepID=UPI0018EFC13F|nr:MULTISPECIES: hypothetical protein [unclassified Nostoc]